jgi:hypothetical protein
MQRPEVEPENLSAEAPKNFTFAYFSGMNGTGTLLEHMTPSLTGWGFFGAQDPAIRSVTIHVANDSTFVLSDMRVGNVPEPSTSLLLAAGLLGLGLVSRRRLAR